MEASQNFYSAMDPSLKIWITINGVILIHVIISQFIYIVSFWNVALFFINLAIFILPLALNLIYLLGTDKIRNFIILTRFRHVIDLFLLAISILFITVLVFVGSGASKIQYTEFLSLLLLSEYFLILAFVFGQLLHIISFKVLQVKALQLQTQAYQPAKKSSDSDDIKV
ncbi:UNKNOWN [Stylonychia lemnae]|uniref:Transmembrane protein n=1 Tax=Stylonychia lemnae TaxID=5949 RepID=A0A078AY98_STYLE|nr:UNKNOWN [Stylonychia lemnae]|eukprot:CDW85773.1 UNKNOWN [Stylonychia lemnae]